jgi:serine/threonine-protein kinase SRPK3
LLGELPPQLSRGAKNSNEFFDEHGTIYLHLTPKTDEVVLLGKLRRIKKLRSWPLSSVLKEKYLFSEEEAAMISSFLLPMLQLDPMKRMSPSKLKSHPWIRDVKI